MAVQIQRVAVWSGWLRLAHWSLAGATLVLLASGWLIAHSPAVAERAVEIHYIAAAILVFGLALRVFLGLFGRGPETFAAMIPGASDWPGIRASLLFYLTLGRAPLPNWYAHNPLWAPLYLVLFVVLAISALSGWLMPDRPLLAGLVYLPDLHRVLADVVALFLLAHLYSVALQDLKGQGADVSAMINGERCFSVDRQGLVPPEPPKVSVRLDDIGRR